MKPGNRINVMKVCDAAPPAFMVFNQIDLDHSALIKIGKGVYKGVAGEFYVKCSEEEIRNHFRMKMKLALTTLRTASGLPESPDIKDFFDSAIVKLEAKKSEKEDANER